MRGVKVSVGGPFFNRMSLPLIAALLFLMGVGPALPWKSASSDEVRAKLMPPAIGAVLLGAIALIMGVRDVYGVIDLRVRRLRRGGESSRVLDRRARATRRASARHGP